MQSIGCITWSKGRFMGHRKLFAAILGCMSISFLTSPAFSLDAAKHENSHAALYANAWRFEFAGGGWPPLNIILSLMPDGTAKTVIKREDGLDGGVLQTGFWRLDAQERVILSLMSDQDCYAFTASSYYDVEIYSAGG